MQSGSRPAICTTCGDTPSPSSRSLASPLRASSGEAIISLTTPAAPIRRASLRITTSVMPDMGARSTAPLIATRPILNMRGGSDGEMPIFWSICILLR